MICPNKSSEDWKRLVSKHGETKAMEMFVENGFDIPIVTDISVQPEVTNDYGKKGYNPKHVKSLSSKNPKAFRRILKKVKKHMPHVQIMEGGLFDADGNWVEITPGEKGMHIRNAFVSAVAFANDPYLETVPHEYAHEYIDMFRFHPLVKKGLEKYGEERLATIMGRHYAGKEVSNSFKNWLDDFWYMVRSLFGMPDIAEELSRAFHQEKSLSSDVYAGSGEIRYQTDDDARYFKEVKGYADSSNLSGEETFRPTTEKEATNYFKNLIEEYKGDHPDSLLKQLMLYTTNKDITEKGEFAGINSSVVEQVKTILALEADKEGELLDSEYSAESLVNDLDQLFSGKEELDLKNEDASRKVFEFLKMAKIFLDQQERDGSHVFTDTDKSVLVDTVANKAVDEIISMDRKKKINYDKVPTWMRGFVKQVEKGMLFLLDPRLVSKFLSGSEDSILSNFYYKAFNKAEELRVNIINTVDDMIGVPKSLYEGSPYLSAKTKIDQIEGKEFSLVTKSDAYGRKTIKLTNDEAISLYLILRQKTKGPYQNITPYETLQKSGFVLDQEEILDRDILPSDTFKMDPKLEKEITEYVEGNFSEFVSSVDNAMGYLYEEINTTHHTETGLNLDKIEKYFPVRYKTDPQFKFGKGRQLINEFKSTMVRPGSTGIIKISGATKVINQHKTSASLYSSYTVPLNNFKKVLNRLEKEFGSDKDKKRYLDSMRGHIDRLSNVGLALSNTDSDRAIDKISNWITSNFAVYALGLNVPVMAKQPVSILLAKNLIDYKYLAKAGWGVGGIVGISPKEIFSRITYTGVQEGETLSPIEWKFDENNETYQTIARLSPKLKYRLKGNSSRETGEVFLESSKKDSIKFFGKKIASKKRLMEGIRIFDSATIMTIWKAVEIEAEEKHGLSGTPFDIYVKQKAEAIVDQTQPTYDLNNRSEIQSLTSPIVRILTMFGSARSKIGMQMIEKFLNYIIDPSLENRKKLMNSTINSIVLTSTAIASINLVKSMLIYGFDEPDEELLSSFKRDMLLTAAGGFFGMSDAIRLVGSRMDDAPWTASMDHPIQLLIEGTADGVASVFKGDVGKGSYQLLNSVFAAKGLPAQILKLPKSVVEQRFLDK